jgi:polar amino acid transport system permease protein
MDYYLKLLSFGPGGWGDELLQGLWITVTLALATLPFGLIGGLLIALAKNTGEKSLVLAANVFTTIFRGLPELLTLFIVYYGGQIALQRFVNLFTDTYVEVNGFVAGMIALGLVFAAFASEVFLSAFRGIPKGQPEAAFSLGLSKFQSFRLVVLPQLVRLALPGLSNLWQVHLKGTSLVSVIALDDLIRKSQIAVGNTKEPLFFFSVVCLVYVAMTLASSRSLAIVEHRLNRGHKR